MHEDMRDDVVSVHAGFPNPAADMSLQGLDLNKLLIKHAASTFFFKIEGHEWQDSGVFDGDIAIIDKALTPRKTDIVIWWEGDGQAFHISRLTKVPLDATIWGVITTTIHQHRGES